MASSAFNVRIYFTAQFGTKWGIDIGIRQLGHLSQIKSRWKDLVNIWPNGLARVPCLTPFHRVKSRSWNCQLNKLSGKIWVWADTHMEEDCFPGSQKEMKESKLHSDKSFNRVTLSNSEKWIQTWHNQPVLYGEQWVRCGTEDGTFMHAAGLSSSWQCVE